MCNRAELVNETGKQAGQKRCSIRIYLASYSAIGRRNCNSGCRKGSALRSQNPRLLPSHSWPSAPEGACKTALLASARGNIVVKNVGWGASQQSGFAKGASQGIEAAGCRLVRSACHVQHAMITGSRNTTQLTSKPSMMPDWQAYSNGTGPAVPTPFMLCRKESLAVPLTDVNPAGLTLLLK